MLERAALIKNINGMREVFVPYDRTDDIQHDIDLIHNRDNSTSEGGVMTLFGASRSGKTKILRDYKSRYPTIARDIVGDNGEFADRMEVVMISVPDGSPKNFFEKLYGTLCNLTVEQVKPLLNRQFDFAEALSEVGKAVGLKLIIVEEAHQALKKAGSAANMAVLLKDLTNMTRFSLVISGTLAAEKLLEANEELSGRVLMGHELEPLNWDAPVDRNWFCEVVNGLDDHLCETVFGRRSGLSEPEIARPLLQASLGQIGHAATLIEVAAFRAVDDMLEGRGRQICGFQCIAATCYDLIAARLPI